MSGQFRVQPAGAPDEKHLRVRFRFADDGGEVRFVDQRMFGGLSYSEGGAGLPAEVAHIARDPFDPLFDPDAVVAAVRRRRTGLKRALLDQTVVSGIGNIYADEALWRAKLHYARATETLKPLQIREILRHAHEVMAEALDVGGTSFDALYVNVNGESGYFERGLNVYGQEGSPCPRDGRPIRREPFMNRSSYRCPRCQPVPRHVRW
jgi:formamidopyrimidine-DNA glycosylase